MRIRWFVTSQGACGSPVLRLRSPLCDRRRALRHEGFELMFERLDYPSPPSLSDGLRGGIRKDIFLSVFQTVKDAARGSLRRSLWYLEAAVHVGIDRPQPDGMHRY